MEIVSIKKYTYNPCENLVSDFSVGDVIDANHMDGWLVVRILDKINAMFFVYFSVSKGIFPNAKC